MSVPSPLETLVAALDSPEQLQQLGDVVNRALQAHYRAQERAALVAQLPNWVEDACSITVERGADDRSGLLVRLNVYVYPGNVSLSAWSDSGGYGQPTQSAAAKLRTLRDALVALAKRISLNLGEAL